MVQVALHMHRQRRLTVRVTTIVPFHRNVHHLERCLRGLAASSVPTEIIVVADSPTEDPAGIAERFGARVVPLTGGPYGPATARNRGAAVATGDVLAFVDSDVVVHPGAVAGLAAVLESEPTVDAVFGAYDDAPDDPGVVSQCKNLAHSFIHQRSSPEATTFWAGLGAVRKAAFSDVGGFDERFRRPSVEDIDLGYRLTIAGYRIRLDPTVQATHLKRWTAWSLIRTDVRDRGIPWMQLLYRYATLRNDLNLTWRYRSAVALAYVAVICAAAAVRWPALLACSLAALAAIAWLDRDYYAFLARMRGARSAAAWFPLHVIHHLGNGLAFVAGTALGLAGDRPIGRRLGALSRTPWSRPVSRRTNRQRAEHFAAMSVEPPTYGSGASSQRIDA
jgi:GT2 family glycosyltransferase